MNRCLAEIKQWLEQTIKFSRKYAQDNPGEYVEGRISAFQDVLSTMAVHLECSSREQCALVENRPTTKTGQPIRIK